ncbi:hypothetical protein Btru_019288 [Bulinus truncatus]|nr:hypothetical protein Btru_019288 [Bulinus truncatus]
MNPEEAAAASMENSVNLEVKLVYNEESDGYELEISDLIGQMAPDTELIIISEVEEPQLILHDDHKAITYIDSSELAALRNIETKKDGKLMNNACNTTIVYTSDNIKHEEIQTDDIKEELIAGVDGAESEVERKPDITNSVVIIDNTNGKLTIRNSNNTENQDKSDLGDVKIYVCEYCIETFPTLGGLQKHKRTVHKLPLDCEICGRKFHDPRVFKAHMLLHDLKKTFKCDICLKIFTQKGMWSRHQLLHAGKKSSVCDVCGKTFAHNGYLQKHLLIHSEEKRFKCDLCGKAFIQRGKAFSQKRTLKKHLVSHNEESGDPNNDSSSAEIKIKKNQDGENDKQYVCEICGQLEDS